MKLRYFFSLICAAVALLSCSDNQTVAGLPQLQLDQTFVTFPLKGGDLDVTLNASSDWQVADYTASWLTLSASSGRAGISKLCLHADSTLNGREVDLRILADGQTQYLRVRQGNLDATLATCADVIHATKSNGKIFRVRAIVRAITNTEWGNMLFGDETGQITIYGTLDADGAEQNFSSLGIEVGDELVVEGPRDTWGTTVELVNVTVVSIKKSLIKIFTPQPTLPAEAGTFSLRVAYKGSGVYLSIPDSCTWLRMGATKFIAGIPTKLETAPADTAILTLGYDANLDEEDRSVAVQLHTATADARSEVEYWITQKSVEKL